MEHLCYVWLVFVMLLRLFIATLWSPDGKVLTSWLFFMMFHCVFVTFPCGILGQISYMIVSILIFPTFPTLVPTKILSISKYIMQVLPTSIFLFLKTLGVIYLKQFWKTVMQILSINAYPQLCQYVFQILRGGG